MGATTADYNLKSTPQLHHIVRARNVSDSTTDTSLNKAREDGWCSEEGYYQKHAEAYAKLVSGTRFVEMSIVHFFHFCCA